MVTARDFRPAAYATVLLGFALAFAAALVSFFGASYHLEFSVLLALSMPFVLQAMSIEFLRSPWLVGSGLVLLGACLVVVIFERYFHFDGYADNAIYWVPLLASAIVLPIAYMLGRQVGD